MNSALICHSVDHPLESLTAAGSTLSEMVPYPQRSFCNALRAALTMMINEGRSADKFDH